MLPAPEFDPAGLTRGQFRYFPVVPGRAEFAVAVREALVAARPKVVAIEMPGSYLAPLRHALRRLPEISVILSGEDEDEAVYYPVEPTDPFVEAARTAGEIGASLLLLEPNSADRPHVTGLYPDTYAIRHIGIDKYVENYRIFPQPRDERIEKHASAIAWKLQGADPFASTFVIVSL